MLFFLQVLPYYNKPNQEGIFQHYKALDAATPLPIIMYNVPGRTGQNVFRRTQLYALQMNVKTYLPPKKPAAILTRSIRSSKTNRLILWSSAVMIRLHCHMIACWCRRIDFCSGQCLSGGIFRNGSPLPEGKFLKGSNHCIINTLILLLPCLPKAVPAV